MQEFEYNLFLGKVCTAIFMIIACYFGTIKFHQTQYGLSKPINDFFPLGFIEETPIVIEKAPAIINNDNAKRKKTTQKPKKIMHPPKPQIIRNNLGFTPLQQDCYDALKGLKVTAKEAKYLIHTIFNKHNPQTIQEFLHLAFMRGK